MRILRAVLLFALASCAWAQSIAITTPAANQTVSGSSFTATVSISSAPNACIVEYLINGESMGYLRAEQTPSFAFTFNPYDIANGQEHHIQAVLMDCFQNTLATSSAVEFTILNTNVVNSQMTVSCTTSDNSTWSGTVECLASQSGSPSGLGYSAFIDGIPSGKDNSNYTAAFPTINLTNGQHTFTISASATNADGQLGVIFAVWEQQITVTNTASVPSQLQINSREAYVSSSGTLQLATPMLLNADGATTTSVTTAQYSVQPFNVSSNTACSVNSSGLITGSAFGGCDIEVFSASPAMSSGTTSASIAAGTAGAPATINDLAPCPAAAHPIGSVFYMVIDTGANQEIFAVGEGGGGYNCNGNVGAGQITGFRGVLGTCACAHALGVGWYIPFQRELFAYVEPTNAILNFTSAGTVASNWTSNSIWLQSEFTGGVEHNYSSSQEPTFTASVLAPLVNQAFNAMEDPIFPSGCIPGSSPCTTQANFQTQIGTYYNTTLPAFNNAGGAHLLENLSWNVFGGGYTDLASGMYPIVIYPGGTGQSGSFTTAAATYATQFAAASGYAISSWGPDEVSSFYGGTSNPCVTIGGGGSCPTSITGNGTTATINWTSPQNLPLTYTNTFSIFGTGTSLDCNATTQACPSGGTTGSFYNATSVAGGIQFASTFNGTATTGTVAVWGSGAWPTSGGSPGYLPATAWTTFRSQTSAASPTLPFSAPPLGGPSGFTYTWMCNGNGDYLRIYYPTNGLNYTPLRVSTYSQVNVVESGSTAIGEGVLGANAGVRGNWSACLSNKLTMPLTTGFTNTYYPVNDLGSGVSITSITNGTVTFPAAHGVYNILPGVTRMTISSNSNSYYNTGWIFNSTPTGTTATISRRFPNTTAGTTPSSGCGSFTATFAEGTMASICNISASTTAQDNNKFIFTSPTCTLQNERGNTFTLSGSGLSSYYTSTTFLYAPESANCTDVGGTAYWREIPAGQSGTGGTAFIMPDNNWHNGTTSQVATNPSIYGPRMIFAENVAAALVGAGGIANWPPGSNPVNYATTGVPNGSVSCNTLNPPFVDSDCPTSRFSGGHPIWEDGTGMLDTWHALVSSYTLLSSPHVTRCLFQPRSAAPDLGVGLETTVREGSNSNCLMVLNETDADQRITAALTPYHTAQPFIQIVGSWKGEQFATLASNATSSSVTIPAGGAAFWIAPLTSDTLLQPLIAANLGDVLGASSVAVEYSCSSYPFTQQTGELPMVVNAGTGLVTVPVDKNTCGSVTYRLRYLGSNGALLATSSVQTL